MAFTPRLTDSGIRNNHIWYSDNPFYQSGYGMPNCTCYAWGRFWEISDPLGSQVTKPTLPLSNGGLWFEQATGYEKSTLLVPSLGAVICFSDDNGGAGHVAVVEQIVNNGETIVCSNSAWESTFFYLTTLNRSNNYKYSHFTFQGFIYHPDYPPVLPTIKKKGFPWYLISDKLRNQRIIRNKRKL